MSRQRQTYSMLIVILLTVVFTCTWTQAKITLPAFFGDHMVIQRDEPITFWGQAEAKETIKVRLDDVVQETTADSEGNWQMEMSAMKAGGPYHLTIESPSESRHIEDVWLGDVWVFSGQSNVHVSFDYFLKLTNIEDRYMEQFREVLQTCQDDKLVRNYMVATKGKEGEKIRNIAENKWFNGTAELVQHCTPIAYYFARNVSRKTGVMTAAVRNAWGGQYIERFYEGSDIYEYMFKPWSKYKIKGIIWYQGENNLYKDGDRLAYALKLQLLIRGFRDLWKNPELPFFIVQLPPARYSSRQYNNENSLSIFLEAQRQALSIPYTAMAVTEDLGMANGLHQPQKYDVALRLANLAFSNVYGFSDAIPAGPQYQSFKVEGEKIRVYFETFGSKLITKDGQVPKYFEILPAGKNQHFVQAETEIQGNTVVVWNSEVQHPVDVRFLFREQDLVNVNLTNAHGIPAATFWAGATFQLHPALLQNP